jgi:CPA2 family monovalent cation:H+ antiporter-2
MGIAGDIALILVACLICALVAQRLGFPLILGYIVGGVLLSPDTSGPSVQNLHEIELLADIGVALLLFTVGLEFPAEKLKPVRNIALIGAPIQMLLVGGYGYFLGRVVGWEWEQAIWFGALITVSSTMVVLKVLMSRGLMETLSSKVMLGILVVQDVAVIPMMILLPAIGNLEEGMAIMGVALVRAIVFVAFMLLVGTRVLPWLLKRVVRWESRELFIIVVVGIGLGVGYATYLVGLSFAFGAFLAGIVLSRSEYSHDALSDMIPLREVFSLIFFASVGLILSPSFLMTHMGLVLGLVVAVLLGKGFLMAVVTRAFGYNRIIPLAVGLSMPQVGEFAFVLARVGRESGGLSQDVYYVVISVAVITMALTPFSSSPAVRVYTWWRGQSDEPVPVPGIDACPNATGKPVLIGYGNQGRFIGGLLAEIGHAPLVLDSDFSRIQEAKEAGFETLCAEATSPEVISKLDLAKANLIIVSISDRFTSRTVAERIKAIGGGPAVVVVATSPDHLAELRELGVDEAVLAPLETGLEMVHQALRRLDYEEMEAHTIIDSVRQNHYQVGSTLTKVQDLAGLRMEWVDLTANRQGRLDELNLRTETGASVVAVIRDGKLRAETGPSFMLRSGDKVAVVGNRSQRAAFKTWARRDTESSEDSGIMLLDP